jgi:crotonobetainyl-CoA:carnitine CoA-transferase CaiB-like acyl-CoA transferase
VAEKPKHGSATNPLVGAYKTSDGRWVELCMLQPGRYWGEFVANAGRPELAADERFDTTEKLMANASQAAELVADIVGSRTLKEMTDVLERGEGQWSIVQNAWELGNDPALREVGMIAQVVDAEGVPRELVANPVQFDETPVSITRAPQFAEHTDDVLSELGLTEDELIQLKIDGAVT